MIDSHCHLDSFEDLQAVIARAQVAGVKKILTIGTQLNDLAKLQDIAQLFPGVVEVTVGIHPDYSDTATTQAVDAYFQGVSWGRAGSVGPIGIGEIGLDYRNSPDHNAKIRQQELFEQQLYYAAALGVPVCIHMRDAAFDVFSILRRVTGVLGVFHCFSGDSDCARQVLDCGFLVSFSGIVTFKNAKTVHEAAGYVPLDQLLIETDAPYLAPTPHRGTRNEPAYVALVCEHIAHLKGVPREEIARQTSLNFYRLFERAGTPGLSEEF
jgi:TatD DNase family protein